MGRIISREAKTIEPCMFFLGTNLLISLHFTISDRSEMTEPPIFKFVGLFDTVEMHYDTDDVDISSVNCIKAIRHALALNEERSLFPLSMYTPMGPLDDDASIMQAWFVGTHVDIGGGAQQDGLSLCPLQWMLIKSKKQGLVLEHNSQGRLKGLVENPLHLVFPDPPPADMAPGNTQQGDQPMMWNFEYSNGLEIPMQDLRLTHNHGNLEKVYGNKLQERRVPKGAAAGPFHHSRHFVHLNNQLCG